MASTQTMETAAQYIIRFRLLCMNEFILSKASIIINVNQTQWYSHDFISSQD